MPLSNVDELLEQLQQANAAIDRNEIDAAIDILTFTLVESRRAGQPGIQATACGTLAQALAIAGRREEAIAYAHRGLDIVEEVQPEAAGQFHQLIAALEGGGEPTIDAALARAAAGKPEEAIADLEARAEEAEAAGDVPMEGSARLALAHVLASTGQGFLAGVQLRAALAISERLGDEKGAEQIRAAIEAVEQAS